MITFRYGETLNTPELLNKDDEVGNIWTDNLLTAKATDYYVVGDNNKPFEFAHTYHGFRYLQISGLEQPIPADRITAAILSTDFENTGEFSCSNAVINRLYENAKYSVLSNSMDVPTDCNQRDERLGWAGDAQDASLFSNYVFNSKRFYSKYLHDMRLRQQSDGAFMDIAPANIGGGGNNCWGDAPVVIAWNLYLQYGDIDILSENYEACRKWVDYLVDTSEESIRFHESYGDHLSMQGTPNELSDTAWSAHSADLVSRMAAVLGYAEDEKKYAGIYKNYREAWQQRFIREDGSVEAGILNEESETAYALGICFGLFDEDMMQQASDRLVILADYSGYIFGSGYSGLCYLLPALTDYGHSDTAMKILENQTPGSLIFTMASGQTTLTESLHTVEYQTGEPSPCLNISGSLNHQAFSGALTYLYTDVLGIKADEKEPGYKHFYLQPAFGGTLTSAEGSYDSVSGKIEVSWTIDSDGKNGNFHCVVPDGTTCTLILPGREDENLKSGTYDIAFVLK